MSTSRARELGKDPTDAEHSLWKHIRLRQLGGYKFRRHQAISRYVVDFVCLEKRLVIEVDGGHHSQADAHDLMRSAWLEGQGFQVLRFWNTQVLEEIEAVKAVIL